MVPQFRRRTVRNDAPGRRGQHDRTVRDGEDAVKFMGDDQDGCAGPFPDAEDQLVEVPSLVVTKMGSTEMEKCLLATAGAGVP